MREEWIRHHPECPSWVDAVARQEFEQCQRIKQAQIGARVPKAEPVERRYEATNCCKGCIGGPRGLLDTASLYCFYYR